jgi:hypothetical protein
MTKKKDRQGEAWTREEIRTLKSIFRNQSNTAVAQMLDRTPKAVERKAAKLKLTKTKKYLRKQLGRKI